MMGFWRRLAQRSGSDITQAQGRPAVLEGLEPRVLLSGAGALDAFTQDDPGAGNEPVVVDFSLSFTGPPPARGKAFPMHVYASDPAGSWKRLPPLRFRLPLDLPGGAYDFAVTITLQPPLVDADPANDLLVFGASYLLA